MVFIFSPGMIMTFMSLAMRANPASTIEIIVNWVIGSVISMAISFGVGAFFGWVIEKIKPKR